MSRRACSDQRRQTLQYAYLVGDRSWVTVCKFSGMGGVAVGIDVVIVVDSPAVIVVALIVVTVVVVTLIAV